MTRSKRRPSKPLIDLSGTLETMDILRSAHAGLHRHHDRINDEEESAAHEAEVRRCRNDAILLPDSDPRRAAAHERLLMLTGRRHQVRRRLRLIPGKLWRRVRDELIVIFLIPLRLLLIVVCNAAAFALLWWLIFNF